LIALLLASGFVYNSIGNIDENALTDLGTLIHLA
jgi:hypothetical protein